MPTVLFVKIDNNNFKITSINKPRNRVMTLQIRLDDNKFSVFFCFAGKHQVSRIDLLLLTVAAQPLRLSHRDFIFL